jgi:hypothetical protein
MREPEPEQKPVFHPAAIRRAEKGSRAMTSLASLGGSVSTSQKWPGRSANLMTGTNPKQLQELDGQTR